VFQALQHLQFAEMDLEGAAFESQEETTRKLLEAVEEFSTYIQRNRSFIPNYGKRYRNSERISTGFVESAVNQVVSKRMAKKQQMQWTQRGAHLLLQVRTRVLNEEWEDVFRRWYPDFRQQQSMEAARDPRNLPLSFLNARFAVHPSIGFGSTTVGRLHGLTSSSPDKSAGSICPREPIPRHCIPFASLSAHPTRSTRPL
jgi:hypothetical protein